MAERPTRWGILGAGLISTDFCLALRTFRPQEHQIVAVAARNLETAQKFAKKHDITTAYDSYENVATDANVDVVYIGTINSNHVSLTLMVLEAGKHVLCEKPMALSAEDVKKVTSLAQQKKLLFVEGFWSRFFPVYDQLRHELANGTIGEVKGLTAMFGLPFDWEKNERVSKKEMGGGVTKDIGCYTVQLACLVFGNEKPDNIFTSGTLHQTGVDRCAHVMMSYKNGRTAQLTVTGESQLPNTALVYGTKGVLEIGEPFWCPVTLKSPSKVHHFELPVTSEPTVYTNSAGFVYQIKAVRKALIEGKLQVEQITHQDSLLIAEIQDTILSQLGVSYDTT